MPQGCIHTLPTVLIRRRRRRAHVRCYYTLLFRVCISRVRYCRHDFSQCATNIYIYILVSLCCFLLLLPYFFLVVVVVDFESVHQPTWDDVITFRSRSFWGHQKMVLTHHLTHMHHLQTEPLLCLLSFWRESLFFYLSYRVIPLFICCVIQI